MENILIGRDMLLEKEIYPRISSNTGFIITGRRGIGKSAILRWAYDNFEGKKVFLSCKESYGEIIKKIAGVQEIDIGKMKLSEIEREVIKGESITMFIDDCDKTTPKQAAFLVTINEIWTVYIAGTDNFREEIKRALWGKQKIKVNSIDKNFRGKMADEIIKETGTMVSKSIIVNESRGVPARAWAIARGEALKDDEEYVNGEEINIAPVLLLIMAIVMITRVLAMGLGEKDLYLLGGIGMGAGYLLRYLILSIKNKGGNNG